MGTWADRKQISTLISHRGPVILLRDADMAGVSRGVVRRVFEAGHLQRLAKSAFVLTQTFDAAVSWEKFRLRSIALVLSTEAGTYLTGAGAAAVLDLPMISEPPDRPIALRPGNARTGHNLSPYGTVRHGYLPAHHRTSRQGVPVVSPSYCAVDVARHFGPRDGLVVADRVVSGDVSREVMTALALEMVHYPGMETARWVVEHADPRTESPLETLGRMAFLGAGLPAPLSNVWIPVAGRWYRVDHLIPDTGVVLEADGAVKYNNRADAAALVVNDRERERLLRSMGFAIARYTWSTAAHRPSEVVYRAREAARFRPAGPVPTCWTVESPYR